MVLKRTDKLGFFYYIDAFTGQRVEFPIGDPLKRASDPQISRVMSSGSFPMFGGKSTTEKKNDYRSACIGEFKAFMRIKPKKRSNKVFIEVCKRANINPYPILNVCV